MVVLIIWSHYVQTLDPLHLLAYMFVNNTDCLAIIFFRKCLALFASS
uniref:Uncharacterized protein n=1 Tax=Arundo donax TaxID=35708 RepID=A0A0A9DRQ1_ARUDO